MSILENYEEVKNQTTVKKNFDGIKLLVHRIKYTIDPGDWDSEVRTALIIGENYQAAENLLIQHMPKGRKHQINEMGDSLFEIHALTLGIKKQLYRMLQNEFDPTSRDNSIKKLTR